jgi:hypothetical protein
MRSGQGAEKLLGFAYFPILLLPAVGRGAVGALRVHSSIWLWWFALQMILGVAAIWLYPYDVRRRTYIVVRRVPGAKARAPQA